MTAAESTSSVLVFKSGEGDYFLVPRDVIERGRVPDERKAEIERLAAEAAGDRADTQGDVQGHLLPLLGLVLCFEVGMLAGVLIADETYADGGGGGSGQTVGQAIDKFVQQGTPKRP